MKPKRGSHVGVKPKRGKKPVARDQHTLNSDWMSMKRRLGNNRNQMWVLNVRLGLGKGGGAV